MSIGAIICTLDNLPILKRQCAILKADPLVDEIVVVINGSIDGSKEWTDTQEGLTVVYHEENRGASVGRNSGLDVAGFADYYLMLDGGIRPLHGGTGCMLEYLERRRGCDVLGVEIPDFDTNPKTAWRRWPGPILDADTYQNLRLSHTAYCLARHRAFDGIRFCEEGPFGEGGYAAEDDELMCQWLDKNIVVHVVTNIHPYRRAGGSHARILRETGIGATNFGSVYEKRVVWLQQNWPQYMHGIQWGEPWITVVVQAGDVRETIGIVRAAHDRLRRRSLEPPWENIPNPYSIVVWGDGLDWLEWAEPRRLRQHHGDVIVVDGQIVRKNEDNEALWTGDFHLWTDVDWKQAIRKGAYLYGLVTSHDELDALLARYNEIHPPQQTCFGHPETRGDLWLTTT